MDNDALAAYFTFFTEIGIIDQLSRAALDASLPDGLINTHFGVVNHLCRVKDGQTPIAIARAFQVPKTSMTHTLAGLEKHGLVEMRPNPKDGRSKRVWLTNAGREFRNASINSLAPTLVEMAATIPPERINDILPLLTNIREFMDEQRES